MKNQEVIDNLVKNRVIIGSSNVNALLKLLYVIAKTLMLRGINVGIVDEGGFAIRYLGLDTSVNQVIHRDPHEICDKANITLLVFMPRNIRQYLKCKAEAIVLLTRYIGYEIKGFSKYWLKSIPGTSEYILISLDNRKRVRVRISGDEIEIVDSPPGMLGRAYHALREAISLYGLVSAKDAVMIISRELGVDKKTAKNILLELAKTRYIVIKEKTVRILT